MKFSRAVNLSRPRFWIYELGTYALGVCAGVVGGGDGYSVSVFLYGLFFLFPANLLIYGINDVFDYETDILNPKKTGYEDVLAPSLHTSVYKYILLTNSVFVILALFIPLKAFGALCLFYFFAFFYSAPPIRAKARPLLDSLFSAGHYVVTGVFGFYITTAEHVNLFFVCAGMCWAVAMHAYSAVPDINADKLSNLETIATRLGKHKTIVLCALLYILAAICVFPYFSYAVFLLALPYAALMYVSYNANEEKLFRVYTYFPKINTLVGMALFFLVLFKIL
ncbi:MAG: hypothetical protein RL292_404 [Candidatus Parcubacteria bacterium]|jgi:4-hydroxybenzoate polyprenyltransferase